MILNLAGDWKMRAEYQTVTSAQAQRVLGLDRTCREQIEVRKVGDRGKRKIWLSENGFLDVTLPGDVTEGLIRAGIVREPLEGVHTEDCQWVSDVAWWLVRKFEITREFLKQDEIRLFLEMVDYHAAVLINGIPCAEHASVYRPLEADIREYLREGTNEIAVRLTNGSEERHAADRLSWFCAMDYCDNDTRFYLRKPQYTYGWDWCPSVPTCGIGGRMEIRGWSGAVISRHRVDTLEIRKDRTAEAEIFLAIDKTRMEQAEDAKLVWRLEEITASPEALPGKEQKEDFHCGLRNSGTFQEGVSGASERIICSGKKELYLAGGRNFCSLRVEIPNAKLWWPNGCGEQNLYRLHAELTCAGEVSILDDDLVGIRTIRICQDRIDEDSRRFDLLVNGEKIFCRGGNWVPADSLYLRISKERYRYLVQEAAECNFNMLRVWGGGLYEPNTFYEECTRRGILIFQDFMYCCAYYPDTEEFRKEAAEEAEYQTRRLARYPCMAIWTGGNEIHESMTDWFGRRPPKLWGAQIYNELLPEILHANAPTAFYMPSSPYFGAPTQRVMRGEYPEISADPETGKYANSALCGDTHAWNFLRRDELNRFRYSFEPEAFDRFPARFSSEFGIHGCLTESSMRRALGLKDGERFSFESPAWKHHGEQPWKREYILDMIENHAREVQCITPEDYLFYGALMQGYIYQEMVEAVRFRPYGSGMLIWMYNDCWPETGWTVIDYYLTRKLDYYPLRRAFAPHKMIIREKENGKVVLKVMNETQEDQNLQLEVGFCGWGEQIPSWTRTKRIPEIVLMRHSAWEYEMTQDEKSMLRESRSERYVSEEQEADTEYGRRAECGFWFVRCLNHPEYETAISMRALFRQEKFPDAEISVSAETIGGDSVRLILKSKEFIPSVVLRCQDDRTHLSDNAFFLLPGEEKEVWAYGTEEVPEAVPVQFQNEKGEKKRSCANKENFEDFW